jgi:hypothetical protein
MGFSHFNSRGKSYILYAARRPGHTRSCPEYLDNGNFKKIVFLIKEPSLIDWGNILPFSRDRIKGLNSVQIISAVMATNCKNLATHRRHPNSTCKST